MVVCMLCVVHVEDPVGAALRPGFRSASESRPIGDPGKWFSLVSSQFPACSYIAGALSVALCGARPRPPLEFPPHVAQPLVGYGVKYMGLVPRFGCLARPVHWPSRLHRLRVHWMLPWMLPWPSRLHHRLGVHWTLPWMLPWPPYTLAAPNVSIACFISSHRFGSVGPWLRLHRYAPCSAQGPSMACVPLFGMVCKLPLGRFLWAIALCRKPP
ncbi:hypothetical protein V6N12_013144 [Hibiscus sabdariffa]|uniref:Uncharacterized protein n=1 Tax=Hibiscus sabdariffa TaxID=183260 RepID=A0ABR2A1X6_9ROSI